MSSERETWGSRLGFIMAAAGFAIGLGSIWRFPYMVSVNGGGAFLFVYLIICFSICVPLYMAEVTLGRKTKLDPIRGMQKLMGKKTPWALIGWLGVLASMVIMSYYLLILGSMLAYFVKMLMGAFNGMNAEDVSAVYKNFTGNPFELMAYTLAALLILGWVVTRGLRKGVERACKTLLPVLFLIIIILAIRSLTLPGAMDGLVWYLTPDFSKITAATVLAAMGQSFFAVGIAVATAFIYGSYLNNDSNIPADSAIIVSLVTFAAFLCGLIIFPALSAFNMPNASGPGLIFETMPLLFNKIPLGTIFGPLFFFLACLAGLTASMGYLEAIVASSISIFRISRKKATLGVLLLLFILNIPCILSQSSWQHIEIWGKNFFQLADFVSGSILMPLGALLIALYTAFVWKFDNFKTECNIGAGSLKVNSKWKPLIVVIIPAAVAIILVTGLFR